MTDRENTPSTSADYHVRLLPEDAAIAVKALGEYAQEAADDDRGEDARRAFQAASTIADQIEEAMCGQSQAGGGTDPSEAKSDS